MKCLAGLFATLALMWTQADASAQDTGASPTLGLTAPSKTLPCAPDQRGKAQLVAIRPNFHTVTGTLSGFDPCHAKVKFRLPEGVQRPALMISIHGGGGMIDVIRSDEAFHRLGLATLAFDAYEMNGFEGRDSLFWARQVTNEARQRMLLTTAWAAYQWALQRSDIDTHRIFLFGISNGAAVATQLSAMVSPQHVRAIIAEGVTPIGLGWPDEVRVPLFLAFGRLDNFGAAQSDMWRWKLTAPCRLNIEFPLSPPGTQRWCNQRSAGEQQIPTVLQWAAPLQAQGRPIEIAYFDDMAHSAFFGPLRLDTARWGNGEWLHSSLGATPEARERFMKAMLEFMGRHDPTTQQAR